MEKVSARVEFTDMASFDKHYISKVPLPVSIVTTAFEGKDTGQTVAWVTNVSFNPPVVMASLGKQQYTNEVIQKSKMFGISFLSKDQATVAKQFGSRSARKGDKFEEFKPKTFRGEEVPVLMIDESNVCLACKLVDCREIAGNSLLFGEVMEVFVAKDQKPALQARGISLIE